MSKQFQMVCGLWITPDFTNVLAGRTSPPRVNHSAIDFAALHDALSELFPYGPPVQIQVPNDTIDQVAVHVRVSGEWGRSIRCEDFGSALLLCAKGTTQKVIDVRTAWASLHALPDRAFAPPPVILPFVVTAADFEDAMIWHTSTRPSLGLKVFDPIEAMSAGDRNKPDNGWLPAWFLERLHQIFNAPFEPMSVLDRMSMDKPPPEYGLAGQG